jgi:hypothetical protein
MGGVYYFYGTTGYRFDLATNTWSPAPSSGTPAVAHEGPVTAFTGSELLVWGGVVEAAPVNTGERFDLATASWTPMSNVDAPSAPTYNAWTGTDWLRGGSPDRRYRPSIDQWLSMQNAGEPATASYGAWLGSRFLAWRPRNDCPPSMPATPELGALYDPIIDRWSSPIAIGGGRRRAGAAVFVGHGLITVGGEESIFNGSDCTAMRLDTADLYDPHANSWSQVGSGLSRLIGTKSAWGGSRIVRENGRYVET